MTKRQAKASGQKKKKQSLQAFLRSPAAARLLICAVGAAVLLAMFVAAIVPKRYDLKVGMEPTSTISATKDVVDEIGTQKKREEAANQVTPTYRFQDDVTEAVLADFDQIFAQLKAVRQYGDTLPDQSAKRLYSKEELQYAREMLTLISLQDYQLTALLHATQEELEEAYSLVYAALQSTMLGHVTEGQEAAAATSIRQIVNYRISPSLGSYVIPTVLTACIRANMLINQEATEMAREAAREAVEPVVYKQGQNIVVRGEGRITANQIAMLSALGLLTGGEVDLPMYLGAVLVVVMVLVMMLLLLRRRGGSVLQDTSRLLLLFTVLALCLGLCILARLINVYLAPLVMCALLATALLGLRTGLICHIGMTLLVAALAAGGSQAYTETMVEMIVCGILSGVAAALMVNVKVSRGWTMLSGLLSCAVAFLGMLGLGLMTANELTGSINRALWMAGGVLLGTLISIAVQPLLEMIFNLPTPMKLLELSNPNQPLLRRLLLEAPGTYHHCTIVSNLAEAAAEAVGANPLLARVGGLYHDIGKLKRPSYFTENQMAGFDAHEHTDPQVSAAIITAHTKDGVALAKAYRLPQEIQTIIGEHHGDTPVMYFYHKALQQADGNPVDIDTYRYDGRPPRTKEGAIVLLCDTIEAAVRTMKNPTPEGIEEFIVKLVRGKLQDGQLSDSPLTLRDIDKICAAATQVLLGVFHGRIEYPTVAESGNQRVIHAIDAEKPAPAEQTLEVPEPTAEKPSVVEPADQEPMPVVMPQIPDAPVVEVEVPPVIKPVEIDDLMQSIEQMNSAVEEKNEAAAKEKETKTGEEQA